MFCPQCDRRVESTHRFCGGCGQSLAGVTTAEMSAPDSSSVAAEMPPPVDAPSDVGAGPVEEVAAPPSLPDLGDRPTRPIEIRRELPEPHWARTETIAVQDDDVSTERVGADESFGSMTGVNRIESDAATPPPPAPMTTGPVPYLPETTPTSTAHMPVV